MNDSMNTPDEFGIKFWLAVDVEIKYILNAIAYLRKDERRASSQGLSDWVVMSIIWNITLEKDKMLLLITSLLHTAWANNCDRRRRP